MSLFPNEDEPTKEILSWKDVRLDAPLYNAKRLIRPMTRE